MASPEHDALADAVRKARAAAPPRGTNDIQPARRAFDQALAFHGNAPGVAVTVVEGGLGGVPAERLDPPSPTGAHLLYLHGGGHVVGSPASHRHLTTRLAAATGATTWVTDHRLAPEHPCPANVDDALAAYRALLEVADAGRIAIAGDSAGGGLALALLVAVREVGLPQPATTALLSPWTDVTCTADAWTTNADDPALDPADLRIQAERYRGALPIDDPVASPAFADLHDLSPLTIVVGTAELLLDDARTVASKVEAKGGDVVLHEADGAMHAFVLFPDLPESKVALDLVVERITQATSA